MSDYETFPLRDYPCPNCGTVVPVYCLKMSQVFGQHETQVPYIAAHDCPSGGDHMKAFGKEGKKW
jgi:hypothetical protein